MCFYKQRCKGISVLDNLCNMLGVSFPLQVTTEKEVCSNNANMMLSFLSFSNWSLLFSIAHSTKLQLNLYNQGCLGTRHLAICNENPKLSKCIVNTFEIIALVLCDMEVFLLCPLYRVTIKRGFSTVYSCSFLGVHHWVWYMLHWTSYGYTVIIWY